MVFQHGVETNFIFGTSLGNSVQVKMNGIQTEGKVTNGKFRIKLPKLTPGGPYTIEATEVPTQKRISLTNVLMGDVYFCSGQSNMAWPISRTWKFEQVVRDSEKYPNIRFLVHRANAKVQWKVTSPQTTAGNSAVCYFFALELHKKLNIPIGTISSSVGGTPIEFWMTKKSAEDCKSSRPGGSLYNSMLVPFADVTFRGFHWYQGESNAGQYQKYNCQLKGLLKDIRSLFSHYNFLFTLVQLAGYERGEFRPIRLVMEKALKELPKSGMATAIDLGEMQDIHPRKKDELGRRIQLVTSALEYKENIEYKGPILKSVGIGRKNNSTKFTVSFEIFGGRSVGLSLQESTFCSTCCNSTKTLFMIITDNAKVYHPSFLRFENNSVHFTIPIPDKEKIVEYRYGWEKYSQCVIVSKDFKLPITSFVRKLNQ